MCFQLVDARLRRMHVIVIMLRAPQLGIVLVVGTRLRRHAELEFPLNVHLVPL